jgi:hypothetical protein
MGPPSAASGGVSPGVMRRPVLVAVAVSGLLLVLATPP